MLALSAPLDSGSASSLGFGARWVLPDPTAQQQQIAQQLKCFAQPQLQIRYRGLGYDRKFNCWRVRIFFNGKQRHVGRFRDTWTAARAYNKVVSFLYGNKAILNLVPEGNDATDTFDIPYAIRQAKLEAESAPSSGTSACSSTGFTAQPSEDLTSGVSDISHSCATVHHLQDTFPPHIGAAHLPLSTGYTLDDRCWLQLASDLSPLNSPVLAPGSLGGASTDLLHPSTEFLQPSTGLLQASTGLLQPMLPSASSMQMCLGTSSTSVSHDASTVRCMASTQQLQLLELNNLLRQQSAPVNHHALGGLSSGFLQASTCPAAPQAPMMAQLYQQPSMLPSLASASVPAATTETSGNIPSTGVAMGVVAHQVGADGAVMGYRVMYKGLSDQRLAPGPAPVDQLGMCGLSGQQLHAVASNGMVIMYAPAPPA